MRASNGIRIAGAAIVALIAVGGCGSSGSQGNSEGAASEGHTSEGQTSATAPTTSATSSASPQGTTPVCAAVNLEFTTGQSEGAAGSVYQPIIMTNKGSATCTLSGFPGVSFVAGDDGHQVGNAANEDKSQQVAPVTLAKGASAQFVVRISNADNYDPSACQPVAARGLRIYTPGETHSAFVPMTLKACSTTTQTLLTTGPVTPVGQ